MNYYRFATTDIELALMGGLVLNHKKHWQPKMKKQNKKAGASFH